MIGCWMAALRRHSVIRAKFLAAKSRHSVIWPATSPATTLAVAVEPEAAVRLQQSE
jgi:hypothetical protein